MKPLELINTLTPIKKLTIVGTGNVASHLFQAYSTLPNAVVMTPEPREGRFDILPDEMPGYDLLGVAQVNSRTLEGLPDYSDVILIAVKDDAIEEVASRLAGSAGIVAHTSGSVPMDILKPFAANYGVFYPLQTFSKDKKLIYQEIPFFIEGSSATTAHTLALVADLVSHKVFEADSDRRKRLHIAAVFACNFANHLVGIADDLLHEEGMDYRVLLPLLKETVAKLEVLSPFEAQTGPAVRNDRKVMAAHTEMLKDDPFRATLYGLLSQSIIATQIGTCHGASTASEASLKKSM